MLRTCSLIASGLLVSVPVCASITYGTEGLMYTQDFDTLSSTGFSNTWTNNSTLPGWYIFSSQSVSGATGRVATRPDNVAPADWVAVDTNTADDAAPTRSRVYSFGADGSTERALGGYTTASGSAAIDQINAGDNIYALAIQNTSGMTLTEFTLAYTGEEWQAHNNITTPTALTFSYLIKAGFDAQADIPTQNTYAPYTLDSDLDFVGPTAAANETPLDGNDPANRISLNKTLDGLTWADGDYLILRWVDNDNGGEDFAVALDDLSFSAVAGVTLDPADLDTDGDVDDADFGIAFAAFTGPGSSASVPEPGSLALIGLGGLFVVRRRRSL